MDETVRLGVDVGGTFTDVALLVGGDLTTAKVPTTDDQADGVLAGVRKACDRAGVDPADVDRFGHATTVAVNAVLEGTGARAALVTTEGFRDVLEIGRQARPALYDLGAEKPDPLVPRRRRFEVAERATVEGVETEPDEAEVRAVAREIEEAGAESVAVALLHAYAHPDNEERVAALLREELDLPVSASHEVLAEFREYERTATTALDAVVTPRVADYLGSLVGHAREAGLPDPDVMQSGGGTAAVDAVRRHAVTTLLSGPAAGVVGAGAATGDGGSADDGPDGERAGLVTFDMGGTSSDVSLRRGGEAERTTDAEIAGHPVGVPTVDVTTVGAGGGSVARVDAGGALRVGPESAGAEPGPACYGRGGEAPTVTDANVVLGYVGADAELGGELEIDADLAREVVAALAAEADLDDRTSGGTDDPAVAAARGVYRVANAAMARAIRSVTVERGHDPRAHALVAFGGAGPMHAAALADDLGVREVLVPRACGVLSAFGLLAADESHDAARTLRTPLADADPEAVEAAFADLRADALARTSAPGDATVERAADCRYAGQSFELTVDAGEPFDPDALAERFHAAHERAHGYRMDEPVELVTLRATATVPGEPPDLGHAADGEARVGTRTAHFPDAGARETAVYRRTGLAAGTTVDGPAVVEAVEHTTVVPPGWVADVLDDGTLRLRGGDG